MGKKENGEAGRRIAADCFEIHKTTQREARSKKLIEVGTWDLGGLVTPSKAAGQGSGQQCRSTGAQKPESHCLLAAVDPDLQAPWRRGPNCGNRASLGRREMRAGIAGIQVGTDLKLNAWYQCQCLTLYSTGSNTPDPT